MAERILKNISSRGLKNAVKGNEYRREASISYGILIGGYILFQILAAVGLIGHNLQGQFVPICVYISLAVSLNLVVYGVCASVLNGRNLLAEVLSVQ